MKKSFQFFFLPFIFFLLSGPAFADQSCCSTHGGEAYCNIATSTLYCQDGTVSTDCTCRAADTPIPTPTSVPTPIPAPTAATPECPAYSTFDKNSGVCKCNTGYIVHENACITSADYCWTEYGGNAYYDKDKNACGCSAGYTWNSDGSKCISMGDLCHNKFGSKSYYNSENNTCNCYQGYAIQNDQCQLIPTQAAAITPTTSNLLATNTPVPTPTTAALKLPSVMPFKVISSKVSPTPVKKSINAEKKYVAVKKENTKGFLQIIQNILYFILHIFI